MSDSQTFELFRPVADGRKPDSAGQQLARRRLPETHRSLEAAAPSYQADPALATAVNMAIAVGAPLLVTGEPGTGKTQVAHHLAWYFGIPLFKYVVRSNSTAEDLKFEFDAVAYLRAAQHKEEGHKTREDFLDKKALWQAYAHNKDRPDANCVLLIDEIDKAPRDFPNDLLLELNEHRFPHPFKPEPENEIAAPRDRPPIVIITSNAERRLPDAFLRRCIFHPIELDEALLRKAVQARADTDFPRLQPGVQDAALECFWAIRKRTLNKPPSTGEVLVWLTVLSAQGVPKDRLNPANLSQLPAITALIKDTHDLETLAL